MELKKDQFKSIEKLENLFQQNNNLLIESQIKNNFQL